MRPISLNKFVDVSHVYLVDRIDGTLAQVAPGEKVCQNVLHQADIFFLPDLTKHKHTLDVRKRSNWEVSDNKTDYVLD